MSSHWSKPKRKKEDMFDQLSDINPVVSSMDCTGLMQTPPLSEDELDSYSEIYDMPKPLKKSRVLMEDYFDDEYIR